MRVPVFHFEIDEYRLLCAIDPDYATNKNARPAVVERRVSHPCGHRLSVRGLVSNYETSFIHLQYTLGVNSSRRLVTPERNL